MLDVLSSAPTRIDIGGATLDIDPLHQILKHPVTINIAVNLRATVRISRSRNNKYSITSEDQRINISGDYQTICSLESLPWSALLFDTVWQSDFPPISIVMNADSPAGAGLGGSSCLGVAILGALLKARSQIDPSYLPLDEQDFVSMVKDLETKLIKVPTGCQDYWAAVRGGLNIIRFPPGRTHVQTKKTSSLGSLSEELILCNSGSSRPSSLNNWEIFKSAFEGSTHVLDMLEKIGEKTEEIIESINKEDLSNILKISMEEWALRKELWPKIMTEKTLKLEEIALRAGAKAVRVCGAGGGGVMAIFADLDRKEEVSRALIEGGGDILDTTMTDAGLCIE
ncbi:MAG: hypothetical protein HQK54_04645 [Oligoflexales bacterium]|nr:hypothetical protein [Oligoflexales bacterium]